MSKLSDIAKEYYEQDMLVKSITDELELAKKERERIKNKLIEEMQEQDLPEFAVDGIEKRFAIKTEQYANYLVENKYKVFDAFRELGYDGIIKEDINPRTLNSTIKELTDGGKRELPEILKPFISIYEQPKISVTKK
jgi:hypothetical protein